MLALNYRFLFEFDDDSVYGLTEFIAWKGTTVIVEKTLTVEEFVETLNN